MTLQRPRKNLLGFKWIDPYWIAYPQNMFKPFGFMVWNVPPGALLRDICVGNRVQVPIGYEPIPLSFFTTGRTFEDVCATLEKKEDLPQFISFDCAEIGNTIRIQTVTIDDKPLGPPLQLAMWGHIPPE